LIPLHTEDSDEWGGARSAQPGRFARANGSEHKEG
jgi:hypothetical protein